MKQITKQPSPTAGVVHVVYIITKLELGGAQKVCLSLLKGLAARGNNTFLISGAHGPLVKEVAANPHTLLLNSLQREVSLSGLWAEVKAFYLLIKHIRILKQKHPHLIVHTHSTKAGLIGRWAALLAGVKSRVHTVHGFGFHPYQNSLAWLVTYFLEWITSWITTHYICVSSHDIKIGRRLLPGFAHKHSLIRAAIDWQQFYIPAQRITLDEEKPLFIFGTVSCFKKQKNLFDLLRAFAIVHERAPHTRLEVIGDGMLRDALRAWIHEHHLEHAITLHGWQEHVAPIMLTWHAFVLSSLWEGLPCALVEARLLRLPVISYDTGGINDIIKTKENGLLYPPGNWQQLADGMLSVCTDKTLYHALHSHQDDLSSFNDQVMVDQHLDLYRQLSR